jgi:hypothetical protein
MNERLAYGLSFPLYVLGLLVVPERDEAAVPQVSVLSPFDKFKLSDELRFQPQCRMPDYAALGVASVVITAFSVIPFRHNQTEYASAESRPVCPRH